MTVYKWLDGRHATYADYTYKLGRWTKRLEGPLVPCAHGYHLCAARHLPKWISRDLYVAEYEGEAVDAEDKLVVRRCRVVEHLTGWNERTARLFAADCAERVLPIFERERPGDDRPRKAIAAARDYANGDIDAAAWAAARAAAWAAAEAADAAEAAAWEWQAERILHYANGGQA